MVKLNRLVLASLLFLVCGCDQSKVEKAEDNEKAALTDADKKAISGTYTFAPRKSW